MESFYDYKRYAILYVDDEEKSLKYFTRACGDTFRVFTAPNAAEGMRILEAHADEIGVVMSDQRMPGEKGVQLLEKARQLRPRVIRILATAYSDLQAAIDAVNSGAIYKYITKPWDVPTLETTLKRSLEFFIVQRERDQLLREKLTALHNLVISDRVLSLGVLAAGVGHRFRHSMRAMRDFLEVVPDTLQRNELDLQQLRQPGIWQDFFRRVRNQTRLVLDLIGLDLQQSSTPSQVDICQKFASELANVDHDIRNRKVEVHCNHPGDSSVVIESPVLERLFRLFLRANLMIVRDEGRISIAASRSAETNQITLRAEAAPAVFPATAIHSMFDPFARKVDLHAEFGSYLLACYLLANHLGGQIAVQADPEGPAVITLTLPIQPATEDPGSEGDSFLLSALTNERLWEKLLSTL